MAAMVIIGGGQAGLQVAESLRAGGWDGAIQLVCGEPHLPYARPPLSKAFLLGAMTAEQLPIRRADALARKGIELLLGCPAVAIDRAGRSVRLADGRVLPYAGLALATGARPRPAPWSGAQLAGVHQLRGLDDAKVLAVDLADARQVLVIGGGFIGLEFAAVAAKLGRQVTVLEAGERLLGRSGGLLLSSFFRQLHEAHGVTIRCGILPMALLGAAGRVTAVSASDGRCYPADLVLVGIGALPNAEIAAAAGLELAAGAIRVDQACRTFDPLIVACGDCATMVAPGRWPVRLESVGAAVEQGKIAAASLLARECPPQAVPWFWSEQYDVRLQIAGLSAGHTRHNIEGDPGAGAFSIHYFQGDRLIACDSINRPQDHMAARRALEKAEAE